MIIELPTDKIVSGDGIRLEYETFDSSQFKRVVKVVLNSNFSPAFSFVKNDGTHFEIPIDLLMDAEQAGAVSGSELDSFIKTVNFNDAYSAQVEFLSSEYLHKGMIDKIHEQMDKTSLKYFDMKAPVDISPRGSTITSKSRFFTKRIVPGRGTNITQQIEDLVTSSIQEINKEISEAKKNGMQEFGLLRIEPVIGQNDEYETSLALKIRYGMV